VYRSIFRACLERFQLCAARQGHYTAVSLEHCGGSERRVFWALKNEDYIADFLLVSRKALTEEEHDIFRFHFLCCRRLGMDRGNFFHAVYRIQQRLGRAYAELQPYALYPLRDYFNTLLRGGRKEVVRAFEAMPTPRNVLRPPLRKIA
jgi:hypothetical protein